MYCRGGDWAEWWLRPSDRLIQVSGKADLTVVASMRVKVPLVPWCIVMVHSHCCTFSMLLYSVPCPQHGHWSHMDTVMVRKLYPINQSIIIWPKFHIKVENLGNVGVLLQIHVSGLEISIIVQNFVWWCPHDICDKQGKFHIHGGNFPCYSQVLC